MEPSPAGEEQEPESPPKELWGASDWLLRVVLPVLVAVLFIGVLLYERGASDVDLRVYAPTHVSPGSPIPVRAFVFEGIRGAELPSIGSRPIALSSQAIEPPAQAGAPLTASQVAGAEGGLPARAEEGEHVLFLAATLDEGELARVQRRVQVTRTPPPSAVAQRVTTSAREYQPGPLRAEAGAPTSLQLDARVPAGVCVPEVPCELCVWVGGEVPAAISVEPTGRGGGGRASRAHHGAWPAWCCWCGASKPRSPCAPRSMGVCSARRALQLPMAPGGLSARVDRAVVQAGESVRLEVTGVGGPAAAAVNVYRGGHWVVATSIAGDDDAPEGGLVLPPLEPGVHHIQAQASAFDPQGAGVAVVCAYPAGDTAEACLLALTGDTRVRSRSDAFAEQLRAGGTLADADTAFRFLAHEHARDLFALPFPSSGIEQVAYGVDERVTWSRIVVAIAIILMGLVAASIVLRRAREGANLADAVWREAGSSEGERDQTRGRLSRGTWLAALAVLAAFVLVAMMVLSRGM
jgi:hypothetical protein